MLRNEKNAQIIKQAALQLGFDYCGIAKAEELTEDAKRLEQWLSKNMHGKMQYM
jgi:epoxyqueuosine reductase